MAQWTLCCLTRALQSIVVLEELCVTETDRIRAIDKQYIAWPGHASSRQTPLALMLHAFTDLDSLNVSARSIAWALRIAIEVTRRKDVYIAESVGPFGITYYSSVYLITPFLNYERTTELAEFARSL